MLVNVQREQILWFVLSILYLGTKSFVQWEWWNWWNCGVTHLKLLPGLGSSLKHQLSTAILVRKFYIQTDFFQAVIHPVIKCKSCSGVHPAPCKPAMPLLTLGWAAPLAAMASAQQLSLINIVCVGAVPRKTFPGAARRPGKLPRILPGMRVEMNLFRIHFHCYQDTPQHQRDEPFGRRRMLNPWLQIS